MQKFTNNFMKLYNEVLEKILFSKCITDRNNKYEKPPRIILSQFVNENKREEGKGIQKM